MSDIQNTRMFLMRIAQSIGMGLLWMIFQMGWGMYFEWAYIGSVPAWMNGVFYVQFVITAWWVVRYIRNKWK
ncbi:MAG TPA: hypothetical protein DEU93_09620 [Chitinophagaceae bacterium]|nr:hypothetical protein [Chitinophagaceae bacterium]HML56757.1 hypothetical protein [Ferruginibacter sp.]